MSPSAWGVDPRSLSGLDWAIAILLVVCVVNAARRGFLVEAFSLAGLVIGLPLAAWNYHAGLHYLQPWVRSAALAEALSFLLIAVGVMLIAGLLGRAVRWSARTVGLGWADRLMGAAFGLLKGAVLVTIGMVAMAAFGPSLPWVAGQMHGSVLAPWFVSAARGTSVVAPEKLAERVRHGVRELHEEQDWLGSAARRGWPDEGGER